MLSFVCSITLQSFQKTAGKNGKIKTSVRIATTRGCEPAGGGLAKCYEMWELAGWGGDAPPSRDSCIFTCLLVAIRRTNGGESLVSKNLLDFYVWWAAGVAATGRIWPPRRRGLRGFPHIFFSWIFSHLFWAPHSSPRLSGRFKG